MTLRRLIGDSLKSLTTTTRHSYTPNVGPIVVQSTSTLTVEQRKRWAGSWVAVKDGEVIAAAHNSRELVPAVRQLGARGRGAVAQFVPEPSDVVMIGVG